MGERGFRLTPANTWFHTTKQGEGNTHAMFKDICQDGFLQLDNAGSVSTTFVKWIMTSLKTYCKNFVSI